MGRGRRLLGQVVLVLAVMAAAFVGARLGLLGTQDAGASHNFGDVPPGAFYHDFVQFLVDNGITAGCGPGLFCGEQAVSFALRRESREALPAWDETLVAVEPTRGAALPGNPGGTVLLRMWYTIARAL